MKKQNLSYNQRKFIWKNFRIEKKLKKINLIKKLVFPLSTISFQ